jgi:hypothetical protein
MLRDFATPSSIHMFAARPSSDLFSPISYLAFSSVLTPTFYHVMHVTADNIYESQVDASKECGQQIMGGRGAGEYEKTRLL